MYRVIAKVYWGGVLTIKMGAYKHFREGEEGLVASVCGFSGFAVDPNP